MLCSSCVLCLVSSSLLSSSALRHPLHPISNLQFQISNVRSSSSRRRPNRPSTSKPSSPSSHRGRRSRNGFPTKNRIWIGSTNPGNQKSQTASGPAKALKERWRPANECRTMMNPVPTGSTNARLGKPRRSRLAMAAYSSWNTPDIEGTHTSRTAVPGFSKNSLAMRTGKLFSRLRNLTMILTKSPISLQFPAGPTPWTAPGIRFMHRFSPLFPRNPFFPALRSGPGFLRPSRQKQIPSSNVTPP